MADEQQPQQGSRIRLPEELQGGVYANNMQVGHTQEEFIIDFLMMAPPAGVVTSRVIISPRHMKRIISALQTNMKRYEDKFGLVEEAEEPTIIVKTEASDTH